MNKNLELLESLASAFTSNMIEFKNGKTWSQEECLECQANLWFIPKEDGTFNVENPADVIATKCTIEECIEIAK